MEHEHATGILCALSHTHIQSSTVLDKMPRQFRGNFEELSDAVRTDLDVPDDLRSSSSTVARIYLKVIDYQVRKRHSEPPGRFGNQDQHLAKRLFCELSKTILWKWEIVCNHGSEYGLNLREVQGYSDFVTHLLYYNDRLAGKRKDPPTFTGLLLEVSEDMKQLVQSCRKFDRDQRYGVLLDELHKTSQKFCDRALGVSMLAVTDNHKELAQSLGMQAISQGLISRLKSSSAPAFWSSDLGQVLSAALVRGGGPDFGPTASVWTDWYGTVRRTDYEDFEEACVALAELTRKGQCAVLAGSRGEHKDNRHELSGQFFHKTMGVWSVLDGRVGQHFLLQHAAAADARCAAEAVTAAAARGRLADRQSDPALMITYVTEADRDSDAAPAAATSRPGSGPPSESPALGSGPEGDRILEQVERVRRRWAAAEKELLHTGVAEPFRANRRVNVSTESPAEPERTVGHDLPKLILEGPLALSEVLSSHQQVLGEARNLTRGGGAEMALMAIKALRKGSKFDTVLLASMNRFIANATAIHEVFDREWRARLKHSTQIAEQTPPMQRAYYESYSQCIRLRQELLEKWHEVEVLVPDEQLAEEFQRIHVSRVQAYQRLASEVSTVPALSLEASGRYERLAN